MRLPCVQLFDIVSSMTTDFGERMLFIGREKIMDETDIINHAIEYIETLFLDDCGGHDAAQSDGKLSRRIRKRHVCITRSLRKRKERKRKIPLLVV